MKRLLCKIRSGSPPHRTVPGIYFQQHMLLPYGPLNPMIIRWGLRSWERALVSLGHVQVLPSRSAKGEPKWLRWCNFRWLATLESIGSFLKPLRTDHVMFRYNYLFVHAFFFFFLHSQPRLSIWLCSPWLWWNGHKHDDEKKKKTPSGAGHAVRSTIIIIFLHWTNG